jgi:hypothetical protein
MPVRRSGQSVNRDGLLRLPWRSYAQHEDKGRLNGGQARVHAGIAPP